MFKAIRVALCAAVVAVSLVLPIIQQTPTAEASSTPRRYTAMRFAIAQKGKPYKYGKTAPSSYDCSGLVYAAYRKAGFTTIPRVANDIYHWSKSQHISASQARWGDLVFWTDGSHAYHVEFMTTHQHLSFGAHHT